MKTQNFDKNGLPLSMRGTTCYKNVSYAKVHYNGLTVGYIAVAGLNEEEQKISNKSTFAFHLGFFDNVLEAAYVAQYFNQNREELLPKLRDIGNGCFYRDYGVDIPTFEHEPIDTEEARIRREKVGQSLLNYTSKTRQKKQDKKPSWVESSYQTPVQLFKEARESLGYVDTTEETRQAFKVFKVEVMSTEDSDSAYALANELLSACE